MSPVFRCRDGCIFLQLKDWRTGWKREVSKQFDCDLFALIIKLEEKAYSRMYKAARPTADEAHWGDDESRWEHAISALAFFGIYFLYYFSPLCLFRVDASVLQKKKMKKSLTTRGDCRKYMAKETRRPRQGRFFSYGILHSHLCLLFSFLPLSPFLSFWPK